MKTLIGKIRKNGGSKLCICTGKGNGLGGCWSILFVSEDDMYHTYKEYIDGDRDRYTTFCCPHCGVETDILEWRVRHAGWLPDIENFMKKNDMTIKLTVDLAITINKKEILLIKRAKEPFMDKLVLPGGHYEVTDQGLANACAREMLEEINLKVDSKEIKLLTILDQGGRDPRPGKYVSVVFTLDLPDLEQLKTCRAGSDAKEIKIMNLNEIKKEMIGFDHFNAIKMLRF